MKVARLKILVLSYHFPPTGGPGVQRIAKFVKYLARAGHSLTVLTSRERSPLRDESLSREIPSSVRVERAGDPGDLLPGELRKFLRPLLVPDRHALWPRSALRKGLRLIRSWQPQVILSTSPPHSCQLLGLELSRRTGIPLVADFRDEWSNYADFNRRARYPERERRQELSVLQGAALIIANHAAAARAFSRMAPGKRIEVLENGVDREDLPSTTAGINASAATSLGYCGRFNPQHSPKLLLEVLHRNPGPWRLEVLGGDANRRWLKDYPELRHRVRFHGYVEHAACLSRLQQYGALLLLATAAHGAVFYPLKMFEYFFLRKPILAVVSEPGPLTDLLDTYGDALWVREDRPLELAAALTRLEVRIRDGRPLFHDPPHGFLERFDRIRQTERLSVLLVEVSHDHRP